jgi:hypothetical protein
VQLIGFVWLSVARGRPCDSALYPTFFSRPGLFFSLSFTVLPAFGAASTAAVEPLLSTGWWLLNLD